MGIPADWPEEGEQAGANILKLMKPANTIPLLQRLMIAK